MAQLLVLAFFLNLLSLGTPGPVVNPNPREGGKGSILEILEKANAGLGDELIEGDIKKKDAAQTDGLSDVLGNALQCASTTCKWPHNADGNVEVPVYIDRQFGRQNTQFITEVLQGIEQVTCIRFNVLKTQRNPPTDYIYIIPGTGCWSYVGRIGGEQQLSLQTNGCLYKSIVQHELSHALGLLHEQNRSDRDSSITIHYENILPEAVNNFNLINTNNLETPFDFNSVMLYHNWAFSANGQMTITANHDPTLEFGFAESMSPIDILRINKLYGCSAYLS